MIDERMIRRLAARRGDPVVTTLYVDVDGARYPRESHVRAHIDAMMRLARDQAEIAGAEVAAAVEEDLADVEAWLARGISRERMRGLIFFSCHRQALFEVVAPAVPVRDQVALAPSPDVAQLADVLDRVAPGLVVLVDRHRSRLVHVVPGAVTELEAPVDIPERRADTDVELGSFAPRHEEQALAHLRRVAAAVATEVRRTPLKWIVLGGTPGDVAELEAHLPPSTAAAVVGRTPMPVTSSDNEIEQSASEVVAAARFRHEVALVDELSERIRQHHGAVGGVASTLEALATRRASTLVVERGADVVDSAVGEALAHRVAVEFCEPGSLGAFEGIGALVRPGS